MDFRNEEKCKNCMYCGSVTSEGNVECTMTPERYKEHEVNESLNNLPCGGRGVRLEVINPPVRYQKNYKEYKAELDAELNRTAQGFVRIGYLLKVARDTNVLAESGYSTVAEFAQAEYGLSKDVVSRYIAINDKYSENGYSEKLSPVYQAYGVAKLQEMLTLPDAVADLVSPDMTRREIQDLKKEVKEEEKTTDIEVILEGNAPDQEEMTLIQKVLHRYFYEEKEHFVKLREVIKGTLDAKDAVEQVLDVLAPSGATVKTARVQGVGRIMLSFKGKDNDIEMLNIRTHDKETLSWQQFLENMTSTFGGKAGKTEWEAIYGEPFSEEKPKEEKKPEVAPVQPKKSVPKVEKTVSKIEKSVLETDESEQQEEQLPGQTSIESDFPEYMPDDAPAAVEKAMEEIEDVEKELENVNSTEYESNSVRGYKAGITSAMKRLENAVEMEDWKEVAKLAGDINWRAERIMEDGAWVEKMKEEIE